MKARDGIGGWLRLAVLVVVCWPGRADGRAQSVNGSLDELSEGERVVELPPMIVLEDKPSARWRYVSFDGVEILSACSEEMTVRFADVYRSQLELMRVVVPEEFLPRFSVPQLMVLFDQRKGLAMPVELQEKANTLESARGPVSPDLSMEALTRTHWEIRLMPNLMVNGVDAIASCADLGKFESSYGWTRWEEGLRLSEGYVRAVLERSAPALPEWYIEGAVELLCTAQIKDDGLLLPPLSWPYRDGRGRPIIGFRRGQTTEDTRAHVMAPLREMFEFSEPAKTAEDQKQLRANRALFIRWAIDGKEPRRAAQLAELVRRSMPEPVSDELLKACFGQSAEQLWREVEGYLPLAARRPALLGASERGSEVRLKVRDASGLEVARIMGDWQRLEATYLAARPAFQESYRAAARKAVAKVYDKHERDPKLLAVSGLIEADAGNEVRARELLEESMALDQSDDFRPAAGLALARLRLKEAASVPEGLRGRLSEMQTRRALEPIMRVRLEAPPMAESYYLISEAWLQTERVPTEVLSVVSDGVELFPAESELVLRAVELHARSGANEEAVRLLTRGLSVVRDEAMRRRFESRLRKLEADATEAVDKRTPAGEGARR